MDLYLIYFVVVPQNIVSLVLEPLGAEFDLSSGPSHAHNFFQARKRIFLIKHPFECKDALEGASGSPLSSISVVLGELLVPHLVSWRVIGGTLNFQNCPFWHP